MLSQQASLTMWTILISKSCRWLLKPKRSTSTLHHNKFTNLDSYIYTYIYIYIYIVLLVGNSNLVVIINLFRRKILLYFPSRQMTFYMLYIYIYIYRERERERKRFGLIWFNGISSIFGYLMPNLVYMYIYIYIICKHKATKLNNSKFTNN